MIAAGFDYFQALALTLFLIVFIGRTLYLQFRHGIRVITLGVGKHGVQQIVEAVFGVGLVVWIIEVLAASLHGPFRLIPAALNPTILDSVPLKVIGSLLIVVGFAFFLSALLAFGNSWRIGIDTRTPGKLVTTGIFALSRNPIFCFIDLYFVGTFLINGTLVFLIFAVAVVAGVHYQILQEERFLTSQYGQSYRDYCRLSGRYMNMRSLARQ